MTPKNDYAHLLSSDTAYIDSLYADYKQDPNSLDESWQMFFKGFEYKLDELYSSESNTSSIATTSVSDTDVQKEFNVFRLVQAFRARGHLLSDTNPIRARKDRNAKLDLIEYGLSESDLDKTFSCATMFGMGGPKKLSEILDYIKLIYCYKIGNRC